MFDITAGGDRAVVPLRFRTYAGSVEERSQHGENKDQDYTEGAGSIRLLPFSGLLQSVGGRDAGRCEADLY